VDDREIVARSLAEARDISALVNASATSAVHSASYSLCLSGSFVVGKARPVGGEADSYLQSSTEVNKWSCTSTFHCRDEVHRDILRCTCAYVTQATRYSYIRM
jgi:hypothetical protein